jgi:hypothetical protein
MQRATRSSSFPSCQALKKSACMVEYTPEESFTLPRVVGMGNWKFVWSLGTGMCGQSIRVYGIGSSS